VKETKICEGADRPKAALSSGMTSIEMMVASARSVGCWSNEAVTLLYLIPWSSILMYRVKNTRFDTL
jgi:hypothetical protein